MTEQEIKDRAPSGATHYNDTDDIDIIYFRRYQGRMQFLDYKDEWVFTLLSFDNIKPL